MSNTQQSLAFCKTLGTEGEHDYGYEVIFLFSDANEAAEFMSEEQEVAAFAGKTFNTKGNLRGQAMSLAIGTPIEGHAWLVVDTTEGSPKCVTQDDRLHEGFEGILFTASESKFI